MVTTDTISWTDVLAEGGEGEVRLAAFRERFGHRPGYLHLAACAAFPPVLTFDLLAKLAQNFPQNHPAFRQGIMVIAADILLSHLCEPLGQGMYEMYEGPKQVLLAALRRHENYGEVYLDRLALFLDKYRQECAVSIPTPALAEVFRFTALSRIDPKQAAAEFLKAYENGAKNEVELMRKLGEEITPLSDQGYTAAHPFQIAMQLVAGIESFESGEMQDGIHLLKSILPNVSAENISDGIKTKVPEEIWNQLELPTQKTPPADFFPKGPRQIVQFLGVNLREKPDLYLLMQSRNSYALNEQGEIIGLNLCSNDLTDEQIQFVWELKSLQALNLGENRLKQVIIPASMPYLRFLNLSENPALDELLFEDGLPGLERLDLSECRLKELALPPGFEALHTLDVQRNQLKVVQIEGACPNLVFLDLSRNRISQLNLPSNLHKLELLYLQGGNQVDDVSDLSFASNLQTINLSGNAITDLTPLKHLLTRDLPFALNQNGNGVLLADCPVNRPPLEIIRQGIKSIADWFASEKQILKQVKILLVGEAKAGKTSILRRLKHDAFRFDEEQTDGIIIEDFDFGELPTFRMQRALHGTKAYFWDFGGQEIMGAIHQFFMTKRSVYLLILEARRDIGVDKKIRQWLRQIQAFAGQSPVIVIINKIDLNPAFGVDTVRLSEDYPQIKSFVTISCKTGEGIDTLKKVLAIHISEAELLTAQIDERWIAIKEDLQRFTREEYYIPHRKFRQICTVHGLHDEAGQIQVIRFLNDLGIVLHFDQLDLGEYFVLDPYWVTTGVYRIITSDTAARQKGQIGLDQLDYIVNQEKDKTWKYKLGGKREVIYSPFELRYLVDIMVQFKLSFYLEGRQKIFIPALLDRKIPPEAIEKFVATAKNLQLVYRYDYLPSSILPRLMVEMKKDIAVPWRTGVILKCRAHIEAEAMVTSSSNEIKIIVIGQRKQQMDYLSIIRYFLDKINDDFEVNTSLFIPLPNHDGHYVPHDNLLKMEKAGVRTYTDWELEKEFAVSELLYGIVPKYESQEMAAEMMPLLYDEEPILRKVKIFLASSSELADDRREFEIFISRENKKWIDKNVFLQLILWEDFIDAMSQSRLQDEYNKAARESDIFISLFATKVGPYTQEEFTEAFGQFEKTGRPLVYTYFKQVVTDTESMNIEDLKSLDNFKKQLKKLGHYPTVYRNTEDLLHQVSKQFDTVLDKI